MSEEVASLLLSRNRGTAPGMEAALDKDALRVDVDESVEKFDYAKQEYTVPVPPKWRLTHEMVKHLERQADGEPVLWAQRKVYTGKVSRLLLVCPV